MSSLFSWITSVLATPVAEEEVDQRGAPDTASIAALADSEDSESVIGVYSEARPSRKAKAFPRRAEPVGAQLPVVDHRPRATPRLAVVEFGSDYQSDILRATDPDQLAELFPVFLQPLACDPTLVGEIARRSPEARVARAVRAGISAARVLAGRFPKQARSPSIPSQNEFYVCLRCQQLPQGLVYITILQDEDTGRLQAGSVSHSFPSLPECEAFLRGAGKQWPEEVEDWPRN